jgi:hypothetical protein
VQKNQVGLKLNGTILLLAYADVNILEDNIEKHRTAFDTNREVGPQTKVEKSKYNIAASPEFREKS